MYYENLSLMYDNNASCDDEWFYYNLFVKIISLSYLWMYGLTAGFCWTRAFISHAA